MRRWQKLAFAVMAWIAAIGAAGIATAQTKPEGEMRFALYVTVPPAWLDPGEADAGSADGAEPRRVLDREPGQAEL
jgi:hypothetical protein